SDDDGAAHLSDLRISRARKSIGGNCLWQFPRTLLRGPLAKSVVFASCASGGAFGAHAAISADIAPWTARKKRGFCELRFGWRLRRSRGNSRGHRLVERQQKTWFLLAALTPRRLSRPRPTPLRLRA